MVDVGFISEAEWRAAVCRESLSWVGTPFHDCAGVKGAGVDCAHLLKCVYVNVGLVKDFKIGPYSPQWFLHRGEELFLDVVRRYAHRVEVALPGDVEMFQFGRHAAHGAIVLDDLSMVHAYMPAGEVLRDSRASYTQHLHSRWSVFR